MNKLISITLLSFLAFLVSCNTKQENKKTDSIKKSTENLSILLSESELNSKNLTELKLIRNEIYARRGYIFKSKELQNYFDKKEWYTPKEGVEITLSEKEKQNVDLIKQIEAKKRKDLTLLKPSNSKSSEYRDTIAINYKDNKKVLDVLTLFPETDMGSWNWSQKERIDMVNYIKKNNVVIDSTEMFLNIKYVKPNTIGIQVVDGSWTLSIYEFDENDYFVVTNDIVGDGNDIRTYNLKNKKLTPTKMVNWFSEFDNKLLIDKSNNCIELLEDNQLTFTYNFSEKDVVKISSWLLNKKESNNCLKGNAIDYRINKAKRTFDITNVYWKKNKTE